MSNLFLEPYYVLGSKLSIGRFTQGYSDAVEPEVNLDIYGSTRFRGPIDLTDSSLKFGGPTCAVGGNGAAVFGLRNSSLGYNSISQGTDNLAAGNGSIVVGQGLVGNNNNQAVFGQYNVSNVGGLLLTVGDGLDANNRSDVLRVSTAGNVFANAIFTNNAINLTDPLYTGALIQSRRPDGAARGIGVDANSVVLYGPQVQLAVSSANGMQTHMTMNNAGTVVTSDCTFYGNVTMIGQTMTTEVQTLTTYANSVQTTDPILLVAHNQSALSNGAPYDIGLIGERGSAGNVAVIWDESLSEWAFIHTKEDGTAAEFSNFSYANLHVNNMNVMNIFTTGTVVHNGDLLGIAKAVANSIFVSNSCQVAGPVQFNTSLLVNGPSVLNTLFVANQATFNNGLFPSEPDSWPLGQVDNRFSRAFLDTVDIYDSLTLPGAVQDTYPLRVGAFGEANVYLYSTSPAYHDSVGIFFDKGQAQLPFAKSALVQEYDSWSLKTGGVKRLVANTAVGNLMVANDLTVNSNLTSYGATAKFVNTVILPGTLQGNTASWSNTTVYSGNLVPGVPDVIAIGQPNNRFSTAYLDGIDLYSSTAPGSLSVGGNGISNVYVYSNTFPVATVCLTLDNQQAAGGKSSIVQDASTLRLMQGSTTFLTANTVTGNLALAADLSAAGNVAFQGQTATVQNTLVSSGLLLANTSFFQADVTVAANIIPRAANVSSLGNASNRFLSGYLSYADIYGAGLRVGSSSATNVYVYTDSTTQAPGITLDAAGNSLPLAKASISQIANALNVTVGGQLALSVDNTSANVMIVNDGAVRGNLRTLGPLTAVNNLVVSSRLTGNTAAFANAVSFQGPVLATANGVTIGNSAARFRGFFQNADLYDATTPIRAGSNASTNVYVYSDSVNPAQAVSVVLDQGGNAAPWGKSAIQQNTSSFSVCTSGQPRIVANTQTGNVTFTNDVLVSSNLQVYGQSSTINQDLRVLGHFAGNNAFWANGTVFDGSLTTLTPNTWTIATPANRFSAAFLNQANLYNQTGTSQLQVGSTQNANVLLYTDSVLVGQTASMSFDKGGLARSTTGQDSNQFFLRQNGLNRLTANNTTGNIAIPSELSVGSNLVVYGQTATISSDLVISGRAAANLLSVAGTSLLAGNLLTAGNVAMGNTGARWQAAFLSNLDVYGSAPQVTVGGAASVGMILAANNTVQDAGQTVQLVFSQSNSSQSVLGQLANGLSISTQGVPRIMVANTGKVLIYNSAVVLGNISVLGQVSTIAGNLGIRGGLSRWPLDFNGYQGEKTVGFGNVGWLGSNGVNQDLSYQAIQSHRFYGNSSATANGNPVLTIGATGNVTVYSNLQPFTDLTTDLGIAASRWRQVVTGNVYASSDSTFNGAVVGALNGIPGTIGLASNAQPSNAFAVVQHPSGNTFLNSSSNGAVRLATGNVVGATYSNARLRIGDSGVASKTLEVVQDTAVGGTLYASQSSGYLSNSAIFAPNSSGWLQLGTLTVGNGAHMKLSLLGQSNLANASTAGGETSVFVSSSSNNAVSGSWYNLGFQQLVSNVKLLQFSSNTYGLFAAQGSNSAQYTASASLTNASFAHACQPTADPGNAANVTQLQQQIILNGFSIFGNSNGVLNNAIGGQPWLLNGNNIAYSSVPSIGIGTIFPQANLDVQGTLNFSGSLLCNYVPLALAQIYFVSNSYVSNAADPGLLSANLGICYPSSVRIGDNKAPSGVLEIIQNQTTFRAGGAGGIASDLSTNANLMSFNVANTAAAWTFTKLNNYGNLSSKQTVATVDSTGSYIQASDLRYKNGVTDVNDEVLARLVALRPRMYKVNGSDRLKYGLIAQETQQVMPEIVHTNEAGFMAVDYGALTPLLLRALQKIMT